MGENTGGFRLTAEPIVPAQSSSEASNVKSRDSYLFKPQMKFSNHMFVAVMHEFTISSVVCGYHKYQHVWSAPIDGRDLAVAILD